MLKKNMKTITLVFAASLMLAQAASAREFADIYTDCGLGALIAPRTPAVAAVTNVTFDLGTTAIISNVSSPETCQGGKALAASFINDSYESLEADLARGQGEYLDSLTTLAGISKDGKDAFAAGLRKGFAASVAADNYTGQTRFQKAENLYNLVYRQPGSQS
ncbi:DUF3015 domain-containing protein [Candidatus Electronema aureum]